MTPLRKQSCDQALTHSGRVRRFAFYDHGCMLTEFSNQLADVVDGTAPAVVQLIGHRRPTSGLVFNNDTVVTMMGSIGRENGLQVRRADGDTVDAALLGWDPATGLAALRAGGLDLTPVALSDSPVRVGHIGIALGRSWSNAITASAGVIAVIGGPLHTGPRRAIDQIFRTTAPMHDGFAGGAFVDSTGRLIGVATARSIRGLGVIIPATIAWKAVAHIVEHGQTKRGYLGIAGQPVRLPEHQRGAGDRERGMLTLAVTPGGPAASAGVLIGDVLLSLDATPVESPQDLLDLLMTVGAGRTARLQLSRGGVLMELNVLVGERPAS
jgi:serine protease DegQ